MLRQLLGPHFENPWFREIKCFYRKCHFLLLYFWLLHKLAFFWGCLDHKCFRNMMAYICICNLHLHILGSRNSLSCSYETRGSSLCSFCHLMHPPKPGGTWEEDWSSLAVLLQVLSWMTSVSPYLVSTFSREVFVKRNILCQSQGVVITLRVRAGNAGTQWRT